jgi:hypothetical protein
MPLSFRQAGSLFVAGPNIGIYPSGNAFAISGSASGSTVGIESISTLGSGTFSIASSVTNNNLVYRTLSGTSSFGIAELTGTLIFTASTPSSSGIISGTNRGTGTGVFFGLTTTDNPNDTLAFYNLSGGNEVGLFINDNNEIEVSRGRNVVNTVSNQGGGAKVYTGITGSSLVVRTISGAAGFTSALINNTSVTGATSAVTANTVVSITPTNTTANRFYIQLSSGLTTDSDFNIDATNGNIGIGIATVTTSNLLLPSGTAAVSQIRLTPFSTEPSSPTNGDIWFNTSGDLKFQKNTTTTDFIFEDNNNSLVGTASSLLSTDSGGTITPKYINTFGVFNTLSSVTISDTTTETSIISSLLTGTTTLLASNNSYNPQLVTGRKYRFNAKGTIDTGDNVNLTIRVKLGSITISSSSTISVGPIGDIYNSEIEIDTTFTVRSSGLIVGSGKIMFLTQPPSTVGGEQVIFGIASRNQPITTTANQVFDCTAQFGTADPSNIITINESTLEFLN